MKWMVYRVSPRPPVRPKQGMGRPDVLHRQEPTARAQDAPNFGQRDVRDRGCRKAPASLLRYRRSLVGEGRFWKSHSRKVTGKGSDAALVELAYNLASIPLLMSSPVRLERVGG